MSVINSKVNNKYLCIIYIETFIINLRYVVADIDDYEKCEMPKWVMNINLQRVSVKLRILQLYALG